MVQKEALKGASDSLFSLLENQRKELEDWEADLSRREELLQTAGNGALPSDILYLNVGGRTGIAVQRSTLTSIEKSVLSAKFSKNWEDGLDRDKDGNIFVDQDPDLFLVLINYLRSRKNTSPHGGTASSPPVSSEFDRMILHYDVMLGVYPIEIHPTSVDDEPQEASTESNEDTDAASISSIQNYPDFSICTTGLRAFDLRSVGHSRVVRGFTIVTGVFTELCVGWRNDTSSVPPSSSTFALGTSPGSSGLDLKDCREVSTLLNGQQSNGPVDSSLFGITEGVTLRFEQERDSHDVWSWSWTKLSGEKSDQKGELSGRAGFRVAAARRIPCISINGTVKIIDIQYESVW